MKETLLLVDDEIGILRVLGISLADRGYRVLKAQNGEEALRVFGEEKPAIVLTDIKMPGMDGLEVLSRVHKEFPALPVVIISGHGTIQTAVEATRLGAYDFIEKPLSIDKVLLTISRALEHRRLVYYRAFADNGLGGKGARTDRDLIPGHSSTQVGIPADNRVGADNRVEYFRARADFCSTA